MQKQRVVVLDGYNVIHAIPELAEHLDRNLESARNRLIQLCRTWRSKRKDVDLFHVVFDGKADVHGDCQPGGPGIKISFSRTKEKADGYILMILEDHKGSTDFTVVSNDRYVREHSRIYGAQVLSVEEFSSRAFKTTDKVSGRKDQETPSKLTPQEERAINQDLMREWGVEE